MSSRRFTRSRKKKAETAAASTPAADPTNSVYSSSDIEKILAKKDQDEDDRARHLVNTLRSSVTSESVKGLPLEIKKKILLAFKLDPNQKAEATLSRWLGDILKLTHFDHQSLTSLTKLTTVQLTVYHLEVLGYLPPSENNNGKNQLAKIILDAKESGLNFYKELPCSEIKNQVMGKAVGYYYKNNRDETRKTLVEHLQDADRQYQDKDDEWIMQANKIQVLVELHRLDPNSVHPKNNNLGKLKEAIIELRRSKEEEEEEEEYGSPNHVEGGGRDPTPTRKSLGSPDRAATSVAGSNGGGRDPSPMDKNTTPPARSRFLFTTPRPKPRPKPTTAGAVAAATPSTDTDANQPPQNVVDHSTKQNDINQRNAAQWNTRGGRGGGGRRGGGEGAGGVGVGGRGGRPPDQMMGGGRGGGRVVVPRREQPTLGGGVPTTPAAALVPQTPVTAALVQQPTTVAPPSSAAIDKVVALIADRDENYKKEMIGLQGQCLQLQQGVNKAHEMATTALSEATTAKKESQQAKKEATTAKKESRQALLAVNGANDRMDGIEEQLRNMGSTIMKSIRKKLSPSSLTFGSPLRSPLRILSFDSKPQESPQQVILSGTEPTTATATGTARRDFSDNGESNESWESDDEGSVGGADDNRMENDGSSDDEDKFLCGTCSGYREYVRSGSFGQHDWHCREHECKNYGKHMSTSSI